MPLLPFRRQGVSPTAVVPNRASDPNRRPISNFDTTRGVPSTAGTQSGFANVRVGEVVGKTNSGDFKMRNRTVTPEQAKQIAVKNHRAGRFTDQAKPAAVPIKNAEQASAARAEAIRIGRARPHTRDTSLPKVPGTPAFRRPGAASMDFARKNPPPAAR